MSDENSIMTKLLPGFRTLMTASLLTMVELGWVIPWYLLFVNRILSVPILKSMLFLGSVMLLAYAITYVLDTLSLINRIRNILQAFILGLSVVFSGRILLQLDGREFFAALLDLSLVAILTFLAVTWMWFRGIQLVQASTHPQTAWHRFRLSLVLFLMYIFLITWTGMAEPNLAWLIFFLFFGLLSLVFARIEYILERTSGKNPFDWRWLISIILLTALLLLIITTLASLLTGQLTLLVDLLAGGIAWLVRAFLFLLALPGMLIAGILGAFMAWIRKQLPETEIEIVETEEPLMPELFQEPVPQVQPLPAHIQAFIFWGVVLLLLVIILWRMSRRTGRTRLATIYQPESLLEPGEARQLLGQALRKTLDDLSSRLRPKVKQLPPGRIRRIYIELLDMLARKGLSRPAHETPLEFLPSIQSLLPGVSEQLDDITSAYNKVRYGGLPEQQLPLDQIESDWQQVVHANAQQLKAN